MKNVLAAVSLVAACATFHNKIVGVSEDDSKAAIQAKDYPKLQAMCTGELKIRTGIANRQDDTCEAAYQIAIEKKDLAWMKPLCHRRKEDFGARYAKACEGSLSLADQANDVATIEGLCKADGYDPACRNAGNRQTFGDLDHPDCAKLPDQFEAAKKTFMKPGDSDPDEYARPVIALAKCNHPEIIFEQITHIGSERGEQAFGTRVLMAAEKLDGATLFAAYQSYVKSHVGKLLFGTAFQNFSGNHVGAWLVKANHLDQCETLVGATAGADPNAQYGMLDYYVEAKCTAAAPQLAGLLTHNSAGVREDACHALGQVGTVAELPKVKILADTDHTNRVVERPEGSGVYVKDYFVADACSNAAGKITLRGGSRHANL